MPKHRCNIWDTNEVISASVGTTAATNSTIPSSVTATPGDIALGALIEDLRLSRRRGRLFAARFCAGLAALDLPAAFLDEVDLFEAVRATPSPFVLMRFRCCSSKRAPARNATQVLVNGSVCMAKLDIQQVHHRHGTGFRALPKQGQQSVSGGLLELLT